MHKEEVKSDCVSVLTQSGWDYIEYSTLP